MLTMYVDCYLEKGMYRERKKELETEKVFTDFQEVA